MVGILGLTALGFAVWQVLSRYFFPQESIGYAEEVIVYLLIWATMIVSSDLVRTDSHVRPDIIRNIVPPAALRWMEAFNCVAAIAFCARSPGTAGRSLRRRIGSMSAAPRICSFRCGSTMRRFLPAAC